MSTCPAGHETTATDYCDTCGIAMDATPAPAPAPTEPSTTVEAAVSGTCPNCSATNPANALFCEACGYDFTTGSMPRPAAPPAPAATPAPEASANPSPPLTEKWVAEIWIDPDWYVDQKSTDPLPSPGLPLVVPLRNTSILIGRLSRSRNITPDIDLSSDNGISRRHAQLTTDGTRWFVEDLGSSNGTYVGGNVGGLPTTPLSPGQKQEISDDDRIYVGAWTRIVVRRATEGE
ncbi:phosphopeptide-binding protein [Nocardioides sp. Root1257]|uniref:FHA domain-containing protein n=1 Tax=unclassified Nocardioides TaxID=2615069 RepID=UPI0006F983BD|nr:MULTISPECIES: FHA domain-containing protein [unclassified Nocardioides]KQW53631.1 phosphopeptide-binding protein [Nocardioides sp. Root1257]KRC56317.1 phosphopeptide-binding protein [Nocardioides sp. Root224]